VTSGEKYIVVVYRRFSSSTLHPNAANIHPVCLRWLHQAEITCPSQAPFTEIVISEYIALYSVYDLMGNVRHYDPLFYAAM